MAGSTEVAAAINDISKLELDCIEFKRACAIAVVSNLSSMRASMFLARGAGINCAMKGVADLCDLSSVATAPGYEDMLKANDLAIVEMICKSR